ncbi:hypothetical protein PIB30_101420, partial [Stylosanthes scabra]|nr:hypothetical protein [Stylosanthes scabra]
AWESTYRRGKLSRHVPSHVWKKLNVTPSLLAHTRATHMCRTARICVEGKLHFQVFQDSRICVEASICVEDIQAQPKL